MRDRRIVGQLRPAAATAGRSCPSAHAITGRRLRRRRRRCRWRAGPCCHGPGHTASWCADLHERRLRWWSWASWVCWAGSRRPNREYGPPSPPERRPAKPCRFRPLRRAVAGDSEVERAGRRQPVQVRVRPAGPAGTPDAALLRGQRQISSRRATKPDPAGQAVGTSGQRASSGDAAKPSSRHLHLGDHERRRQGWSQAQQLASRAG
jgi:hypothetical protein